MSLMLNRKTELVRINPKDARKLEHSTNDGRTWNVLFPGASYQGEFEDLTDNGKEILATTTNGLFYSTNEGRTWNKRN